MPLRLVPKPLILLVEDNSDIRDAFQELLKNEGFEVAAAANGKEAMQLLPRLHDPSLIFLDLNMPVMNGREFLEARKKAGLAPNSPVVVFAATKQQEKLEGVVDWIKKPVDVDVLLDAVQKYATT